MSVDLTFIYLNDVFHSFQTIVESECLGGSSMLVSEEEGVHTESLLFTSVKLLNAILSEWSLILKSFWKYLGANE